jgi:hypothetical protein
VLADRERFVSDEDLLDEQEQLMIDREMDRERVCNVFFLWILFINILINFYLTINIARGLPDLKGTAEAAGVGDGAAGARCRLPVGLAYGQGLPALSLPTGGERPPAPSRLHSRRLFLHSRFLLQ